MTHLADMLDRVQRRTPLILFLVALALNLAAWASVVGADSFALGSLLHDDGFYYLLIAKNILAGRGVTFDGVNPTTGFQPLYLGVTLGVTKLSLWTGTSVFRWIFFANLAFTAGAAVTLAAAVRRLKPDLSPSRVYLWAALLLPLNFPLVLKRLGAGLEMALGLFLLCLLLHAFCAQGRERPRLRYRFTVGLLLGALVLTRIDYLVFAAAFAGYVLVGRKERRLADLVPYAAGMLLLVGGYALIAAHFMDSIVPVSFLAKRYYSGQHVQALTAFGHLREFFGNLVRPWLYTLAYETFGLYWGLGKAGMVTGALALAAAAAALVGIKRRVPYDILVRSRAIWFVAAMVAHLVAFAWSGQGYVSAAYFWYYTPELILSVFIILVLVVVNQRPTHLNWVLSTVIGVVLVLSTGLYDVGQDMDSYRQYRDMITSVRALTPADAVIGSWDAGYNGYWLEPRTVINMDGMVNSTSYLNQVVKTEGYARFLYERRIRYVLNMVPDNAQATAATDFGFFFDRGLKRECYDVLGRFPFSRQNLTVYLLDYKCIAPGEIRN